MRIILLGEQIVTSLCPTLGKRYAQTYEGLCPKSIKDPAGKTLRISFIGPPPHITYNPIGGSDFLIISLLADKLQLSPTFVPEQSYYTQAHSVGNFICSLVMVYSSRLR